MKICIRIERGGMKCFRTCVEKIFTLRYGRHFPHAQSPMEVGMSLKMYNCKFVAHVAGNGKVHGFRDRRAANTSCRVSEYMLRWEHGSVTVLLF